MDELLDRPTALRVLCALGRRQKLTMRQFLEASRHARQLGTELRDHLERLGYISIRNVGGHGNAGELEITLTPFGRRVVEHLLAAGDVIERHRAKERSESSVRRA